MKKIAETADATTEAVQAVARHHDEAIRRIGKAAATPRLLAELVLVAEAYGARHELSGGIAKECAQLVLRKFDEIAIGEVREAYRQWASGEITVTGGEMYGGQFNAAQLGKVLTAYTLRRRGIVAALHNAFEQERRIKDEKVRTEAQRAKFEAEFPSTFHKVRSTAKSWQDVPVYFSRVLWKRGLINITEEQREAIRQKAKAAAEQQINEARHNSRPFEKVGSVEERTPNIYRQMAVYELAISNPDYQLIWGKPQ